MDMQPKYRQKIIDFVNGVSCHKQGGECRAFILEKDASELFSLVEKDVREEGVQLRFKPYKVNSHMQVRVLENDPDKIITIDFSKVNEAYVESTDTETRLVVNHPQGGLYITEHRED